MIVLHLRRQNNMKKKGKMIEILSGEFPMKKTLKIEESF
jgi:hypothetical protein